MPLAGQVEDSTYFLSLGAFFFFLKLKYVKVLLAQSCPTLCNPWSVAPQAPLSMEFSRQEYWSRSPLPSPRIFLTQGLDLGLLHRRQILHRLRHQGSGNAGLVFLYSKGIQLLICIFCTAFSVTVYCRILNIGAMRQDLVVHLWYA